MRYRAPPVPQEIVCSCVSCAWLRMWVHGIFVRPPIWMSILKLCIVYMGACSGAVRLPANTFAFNNFQQISSLSVCCYTYILVTTQYYTIFFRLCQSMHIHEHHLDFRNFFFFFYLFLRVDSIAYLYFLLARFAIHFTAASIFPIPYFLYDNLRMNSVS